MLENILANIFVLILGLAIGSFLNCLIYRLEKEKPISGRSFCPNCKQQLKWHDLFPVLSYLTLWGKCRNCKKEISIQYPLVELATALMFVIVFNWQFQILQFNAFQLLNLFFLFYMTASLVAIFVYDLKHFIIPDIILLPAIVITVAHKFVLNPNFHFLTFLYGAALAAGFFLAIYLFSKGRAMGFGDVKLALLMGFLLGLENVLVALFFAFFFGAIISIILMIFYGRKLKSEVPFGPFLITGTFIAFLFGNQIVQWYLNLFLI